MSATVLDLDHLRNDYGERIHALAYQFGASNIRVFGSLARNEQGSSSDVDLLVEMKPGTSLLKRIGLIHALEELLGRHVDVATVNSLKVRIRERVLDEAVPL